MGGGLESNCVGRVYGADGARTVNTTYAAPLNIYIYISLTVLLSRLYSSDLNIVAVDFS